MHSVRIRSFALGMTAAALIFAAAVSLVAAATFEDGFAGTTLKPEWRVSIPKDGATVAVNNGLSISVPETPYDAWTGIQNAPAVTLPAPDGDFTFSAFLDSVLDPDGNPAEGGPYHAVVTVAFSDSDLFYWGPYRSNSNLVLERSGVNSIGSAPIDSTPVWLQIKKTGNDYHFYYKQNDADPWMELTDVNGNPVVRSVATKPLTVGLMLKTWDVNGVACTANWSRVKLEAAQLRFFGNVTGKITTNGPSPAKVGVEVVDNAGTVVATALVDPDGTYTASAAAGTYTVRLVGDALEIPQPEATKTGVTVRAGQATTIDFTVKLLPDLNPAAHEVFEDKFAGTTLRPEWIKDIPAEGPTVTVSNGLHLSLPAGPFDYWVTVDNCPKVKLPAPVGDFNVSAQIVSATDPSGNPVEGAEYQTMVFVSYGPNDFYVLGLVMSNARLAIQRAGAGDQQFPIPGVPVWVQISKVGNDYYFYYKTSESDPWTPLAGADGKPIVKNVTKRPLEVGLLHKSWGAGAEVTGNFGSFRLEANELRFYGRIVGKITTNGPSPAKVRVQATDPYGVVVGTAPVGTDGSYTLTVGSGPYTVRVIGDALETPQPEAVKTSVMVEPGAATTVDFSVRLLPDLNPATNEVFEDNFAGTALKPEWTTRIPVPGPTISAKDGLIISQTGGFFDAWAGVADSPEVFLPAPLGDFIATAQIRSITDPDGNPADGYNYHAVLAVNLGGTDTLYWGAYQSNNRLMLERAGVNNIASTNIDGLPAWVQIKKIGNDYTFAYKINESDPWTDLTDANGNPVSLYVPKKAVSIGLMLKSWNPGGAFTADFGRFRLEAAKLRFSGTVAGKVTAAVSTADWTVHVVDAEGAVVGTAPVSAGAYIIAVPTGTYTLRLVDSVQAVMTTKSDVAVERSKTTTVDFDLTAPTVVPGDLDGNGKVTISDVTIALRIAVGLQKATAQQLAAGDLNKDGSIGIPEVTRMLRAAVGLGAL